MLLDALLAATERLIITYTGNDERTNTAAARRRFRSASCSTSSIATVRCERRARRASRSSSTIRCSRSIPRNFAAGRARAPTGRGASTRQALAGARALTRPRTAPSAVPAGAAAAAGRHAWSSSTTSCGSSSTRSARSCASGSGSASASSSTRSRTSCRSSSTRSSKWGVGQRLLDGVLAGVDARAPACRPRSRAARSRRATSRMPVIDADRPDRRAQLAARGERRSAPTGRRRSLDVNLALPDGRTLAGTVTGVCGDVLPRDRPTRACGRATGCAAWVRLLALSAGRPERPFEAVDRSGARRRDAATSTRRADRAARRRSGRRAAARARAARGAGRPLRPRACASRCRSVVRRRRPPTPQAAAIGRTRSRRPQREWTSRRSSFDQGGPRARAPARATAASVRSTSCSRCRRAPTSRRRLGRPDEPTPLRRATRAGCGTACSAREEVERPMSAELDVHRRSTSAVRCRSGVTVLEASAGTGKTYTIAALTARYVAEGTPLDRLLLVTFTRMATGELRERVRERLVGGEQALTRVARRRVPADATTGRDAARRAAPPTRSSVRRDRLARAVADFDAATIATTHGFCQEVLAGLGIARRPRARRRRSSRTSRDLLERGRRRPLRAALPPPRRRARVRAAARRCEIARAAIDNPMAAIEPRGEPTDSTRGDALPARARRSATSSSSASGGWR